MKLCVVIFLLILLSFSTNLYAQETPHINDCNKGNAKVCLGIADKLLDEEQFKEAFNYYSKLCELEVGKGCRRVGWINNEVFDTEIELYKPMYEKACALGDMMGCNNLGYTIRAEEQYEKANELFLQACDSKIDLGCDNLADTYFNGWGVEIDNEKAAKLYQSACDLELSHACDSAGDVYYYQLKNYKTALKWYKKACKLSYGASCYDEAYQYENGEGTKTNISKANKLYERACELNEGRGCTALGLAYMHLADEDDPKIKQDYVKGAALLERGCSLGHGKGCSDLGYAYENGDGVETSLSKALQAYQFGCTEVYNYSQAACYNAGWYHEAGIASDRNVELAKQYYERACDANSSKACGTLAALANPLFVDDVSKASAAKTIFLTQKEFNGNLGGSTGADSKCQAEADAPGSKVQGKTFKAWISGERKEGTPGTTRTLLRSESPYKLVDGTLLANDFKELVSTGPRSFINVFASGEASKERYVLYAWTALTDRGELKQDNCSNWKSASASETGLLGDAIVKHSLWSDFIVDKCSDKFRLYCVEQ